VNRRRPQTPALIHRPHQVVDARAEVAIVRDGVASHWHSWGVRDRELDVPVGDDTIWRLYSMTKPVAGVAMMTLYEQGHFQLDDPVERWIPEWKNWLSDHDLASMTANMGEWPLRRRQRLRPDRGGAR